MDEAGTNHEQAILVLCGKPADDEEKYGKGESDARYDILDIGRLKH